MEPLAPKRCILVVDDERSVRSTLRLLLKRDHDVVLAESCEDGLKLLEERASAINLVLLDKGFPTGSMQGDELLGIIRERWPSLIVIMLTVDYQVPAAVRCAKQGAFQYVNKMPNLAETVPPAVSDALALNRHRQETDDYERELRHRRQVELAMHAGLIEAPPSPLKAEPHRVRDFETVRKEHYIYAYHAHGGNLLYAARSLHVSYDSYRDKLIEWGIHIPSRRKSSAKPVHRRQPRHPLPV